MANNDDSDSEQDYAATSETNHLDRGSALLTRKQREYLLGMSDIEPKSAEERAIRNRLRKRLYNTLLDLEVLNGELEGRDLEKVFEEPDLFNSIGHIFALFFDGVARASVHNHPSEGYERPSDSVLEMYAGFVESGITNLYVQRGFDVEDISVSIELELGTNVGDIKNKELNSLSLDERILLFQSGDISREEFEKSLSDG